jgi:hypothetical protein
MVAGDSLYFDGKIEHTVTIKEDAKAIIIAIKK